MTSPTPYEDALAKVATPVTGSWLDDETTFVTAATDLTDVAARLKSVAADPGWSVGICLTVPPFPAETPDADPAADPPVFFHEPPWGDEAAHYHYADMRQENGQLFARRRTGYAMVVTGTGSTVSVAQDAAVTRARNVVIPDMRWRGDIGDRFLDGEGERLRILGWLTA